MAADTTPETGLVTVNRQLPAVLQAEVEEAKGYALEQHSSATRRAYRGDWEVFTVWCEERGIEPLPALPEAVATFLSSQAKAGLKASTLARRAAAIRYAHAIAGHEPPTNAEVVKATMRGIRRSLGTAKTQKAPATSDRVLDMVGHVPEGLKGLRDRALLLLGFAGAFRRSELVALTVADLEEVAEGLRVHVRKSKTDQEGSGQVIPIVRGSKACPVEAVASWLEAAGIEEGPVFRSVTKGGKVSEKALTPHSVGLIVKHYAQRAGYNGSDFGGHSLRAGFATSAVVNGASLFRVMDVTRHKSTDTLRGYVRRAEEFKEHAGVGLL